MTFAGLKTIFQKPQFYGSQNGEAEPLQVYCHHCGEDFAATTIDVWVYVNLFAEELFYKMRIAEFLNQWSKLNARYQGAFGSDTKEKGARSVITT